jgi:PAS domain S-box-containing protein
MESHLKILILEDNLSDADLIQRLLKKEIPSCEFCLATNKISFVNALTVFSPEVIISDYSLPQFNATEALEITRQWSLHIPFILVTGTVSEEIAVNMIKSGADDYILKDRLKRLPAAIAAAVKQRETEIEKKKKNEELKENEKKYRNLVERISDVFIALDLNWQFSYANKKAEELFNKPMGYLIGKDIWSLLNEDDNTVFFDPYHLAMQKQENLYLKNYSVTFGKWLETNIYPSNSGISVYIRDITKQKESEENLKALEKEITLQKIQEQKKITRAVLIAQENERNHLGQELHDNVNQILTGAKIFLSIAGNKNVTVKELIKYPVELIDNSISEIRLLCHRMVTPIIDINLEDVILDLIQPLTKKGTIQTTFIYDVHKKLISDDLKLNIFRIIQEQINNIQKYAEAKNVTISIQENNKEITVITSDDGKGFNVNQKRGGIGISNMINRTESFNGTILIESSVGNGCRTQINIPY